MLTYIKTLIKGQLHTFDPFVYLDTEDKPRKTMTTRVKWLGTRSEFSYSEKKAAKKVFKTLHKENPALKGYIHLF